MNLRWMTLLAVGSCVAGCATSSSSAPTGHDTAESVAASGAGSGDDEAAQASVGEFHQMHHRGGLASFIGLALETLGPDDSRRPQVEKAQADLNAKLAPVYDAEKALIGVLADGVAAGSVDPGKVDAAIANLSTAGAAAVDATSDALNLLHTLLSPDERAALVEKVQAHWQVWKQVNHEQKPGGREPGGRLAHLTEELGLTPEQVEKISGVLQASPGAHPFDPQEMDTHVQSFAAAFAGDAFDAKSILAAREANGRVTGHGARRMANFVEAVTPVLTADQRARLAADLREHLSH